MGLWTASGVLGEGVTLVAMRWRIWLVVALVLHAVALYLPGSPEPSTWSVPGLDKVVHVALFGFPAYLIVRTTHAAWPLGLLAVHAPLSEVVQYAAVPYRSGDVLDLLADLVGVALGWWIGRAATRRTRAHAAESGHGRSA